MPGPEPLSQGSVSLGLRGAPESTCSGGAVAPPPPDPVSDDREDGEGHDQEEGPLPPQPFEHRLHLLAEHVTEDDPQRRISQRADQVVEDEAVIGNLSGAAEDRREQPDTRRVAAEDDGHRPEAPEILHGVFDTPVRAEREPAVERQERFAAARAGQVEDVVSDKRAERAGDDRERDLEAPAREGAGEYEDDPARKWDADRVDHAHDEQGQI